MTFRYLQTFAHEQAIQRAALIYSDGRRGTKGSRLEWLEDKISIMGGIRNNEMGIMGQEGILGYYDCGACMFLFFFLSRQCGECGSVQGCACGQPSIGIIHGS
ncbi:hypothetical protein D3C75_960590 [compost metagenome]